MGSPGSGRSPKRSSGCGRFPTSIKEDAMKRSKIALIGLFALAVMLGPLAGTVPAQPQGIFVPLLVYRTGPYAPSGIPIANGMADYFNLVNDRDGGINGVKLVWEECETQYDTKQGVECYERLKGKNPVLVNPYSTGITYTLIPKAAVDKVVVFSMGYGMTAAADGRWFPWVFSFPTTYWSQASAVIRYIGQQEGGLDKLKGKKIAHIYHNSPYGREANPTLEDLAKKYAFELTLLAVDSPGQEQTPTWLPPVTAPRPTRARPSMLRARTSRSSRTSSSTSTTRVRAPERKRTWARLSTTAASPTPCSPSRPSAPRWGNTATRCSRASRSGGGSRTST